MAEIDVTKSSSSSVEITKDELVDGLRNIPQKNKNKLKTRLSSPTAQYNLDTLNRGNQVLNFLKDQGYTYELQARSRGNGLLAKVRGLGGSDFLITVAMADDLEKNENSYDRNGANKVGNVTMNNRNFYTASQGQGLQNTFDMFLALTGKLQVEIDPPKDSSSKRKRDKFDRAYNVVDENGNVLSRFFRRKTRENDMQLEPNDLEQDLEPDEFLVEAFGEDDTSLTRSPLEELIHETNERIEREADENNMIMIVNQGFQENIEVAPIQYDNNRTYENMDLDMLLALNDRNTLADAIVREMLVNEDFTLDNDQIIAEDGLKDLLMENTAGIRSNTVNPNELGPNYQAVLDMVRENLEKQNMSNINVSIDEDHVIHWTGERSYYQGISSKRKNETKELSGEIGQIFLPNESGIINTKFRTVEASSDRNYKMIPSYTGYYADRDGVEIVPETKYGKLDNREGQFVVRENGEFLKIPDPDIKGSKPRYWTLDELSPEKIKKMSMMISRSPRSEFRVPIAMTQREKKVYEVATVTLEDGREVVADEHGNPLTHPKDKNMMFSKEQFPEHILKAQINSINRRNAARPNDQIPMIGYTTRKPTLRESIRVRGFDQSLEQNLEAIIARQVLQEQSSYKDTTSLNKLYHGDVYGTRIKGEGFPPESVIETYKNRVRFPNEITDMSNEELDDALTIDSKGQTVDFRKSATHRHNLIAFEGVFDRSLSSDGQALGKIKYLNEGVTVNRDGSLNIPEDNYMAAAPIYKDMPYSWGDPSDRAMMGGNQYMKARAVEPTKVAFMTYKGYTHEDAIVMSKNYARKAGLIANGIDDANEIIELEIGDKMSDKHGNKGVISRKAIILDDPIFEQNPELEVIVNPHSVPSRKNTGVILEMQANGGIEDVMYNGKVVGQMGTIDMITTDITAEDKTHTYEHGEGRLGRSFGVQEAWVANALELDGVMDEVYGENKKAYERLRKYMNVTGLDIDEDGVMYQSNSVKYDPETREYNMEVIDFKGYDKEQGLSLPEGEAAIKLPVNVDLPSGRSSDTLYVLPEEFRKTQELYDGGRMYHDYSRVYSEIAEISGDFELKKQEWIQNYIGENGENNFDFTDKQQLDMFMEYIPDEHKQEISEHITRTQNDIQGKVSQLTDRIVEDKLGGFVSIDQEKNRELRDGAAVKRSIMKRDIMGRQVPHSATSVVAADPTVDIDTIRVSPEIYEKMNLKNPEEDRVLLWRDPALHDGSMRSFKIEKDESIKGVGINPLVTESFGMDFDGDTVGLYAPKSEAAQKDLREKAALEKHLIDPTSEEFTGNIGMDFVSSAYKAGYVGENITQGRLKGREDEVKDMNPKDQLQFMLTEMAKEDNGAKQINQLWMDTVTTDNNIGASRINVRTREEVLESMMHMAKIGAKGKPKGIQSELEQQFDKEGITSYAQKMKHADFRSTAKGKNGNEPTVMQYYDRGKYMLDLKKQIEDEKLDPKKKDLAGKQLKYMLTAGHYRTDKKTGFTEWVEHKGSMARDYNRTREAQAGKVDLTGRAGAKSQKLVSIMYDDKDGAMSAMEVTEPLTQATLKLKHNPEDTPEIENLLNDFDKLLNEGGKSKNDFISEFTNEKGTGMYDKIGLNVNKKHLSKVFDAISDGDKENPTTRPIEDVMNEKMSPLMKVNMKGYDAIREMAEDNSNNLRKIAMGYQDVKLHSFKDGNYSGKHVPKNLKDVSAPSIKKEADKCYDRALAKHNEQEKQKVQEVEKSPSKSNVEQEHSINNKVDKTSQEFVNKEHVIKEEVKQVASKTHSNDWYVVNKVMPVDEKEAKDQAKQAFDKQNHNGKSFDEYYEEVSKSEDPKENPIMQLENDPDYQNYKYAKSYENDSKDPKYANFTAYKEHLNQEQSKEAQRIAKENKKNNVRTERIKKEDMTDVITKSIANGEVKDVSEQISRQDNDSIKNRVELVNKIKNEPVDLNTEYIEVSKEEALQKFAKDYEKEPVLNNDDMSVSEYINDLDDEFPIEERLEIDESYQRYKRVEKEDPSIDYDTFKYIDDRINNFDKEVELNEKVVEYEEELNREKPKVQPARVQKVEPEGFEMA